MCKPHFSTMEQGREGIDVAVLHVVNIVSWSHCHDNMRHVQHTILRPIHVELEQAFEGWRDLV